MEDYGAPIKVIKYENTYRMAPEQDQRFKQKAVTDLISECVDRNLKGKEYEPIEAAQLAKQMSDEIKERAKDATYNRYKLVVQVSIGQKSGQSVRVASRCLWDGSNDNFASYTFENATIFCVANVFALYLE